MTRTYWCRTCGRGGHNFGDGLGPELLARVGIIAEWTRPADAELVTVGSVLSKFTPAWRGTVWGTGYITADMTGRFPRARIVSVRGELTRVRARLRSSTPIGDPGVLASDLLETQVIKQVGAICVPHYVDHEMVGRHPEAFVAKIDGNYQNLLGAIASADLVFTSSLHAMIAADSFGVPHVWEPCPRVTGGAFKFNDYLSAFGETITPGVERLTPRPAMLQKKRDVREQLRALAEQFAQTVDKG